MYHAREMAVGFIAPLSTAWEKRQDPWGCTGGIYSLAALSENALTQMGWRIHRFPPSLCFGKNPFSLRWCRVLPLTSQQQDQARGWARLEIPSLSFGSWRIPFSQLQVLFACSTGPPEHSNLDMPLKNSFDGHYTEPQSSQVERWEQRKEDAPPVRGVGEGLCMQGCLSWPPWEPKPGMYYPESPLRLPGQVCSTSWSWTSCGCWTQLQCCSETSLLAHSAYPSPEMFNGVAAVAAEIVWETRQHSENVFPVFLLVQKEKRATPMQATETKSNVLLVFAAVPKTLVWVCVPTVAWALPVFSWPRCQKSATRDLRRQGLVQEERELKDADSGEMWEWVSQCRHHLGLLCKPGLRWELTVPSTGPLSRTSQGERGKGTPRNGKRPSNGHRAGQWWGQEKRPPQIRLTGRGRTHQRRVKSKICIYRISSISSAGCNPTIKNKDPTAKHLIGHMLQTGRNCNVACGTRVFSRDFQWENESTSNLFHTGVTTSSSLCIFRQTCYEEAWESGNEEACRCVVKAVLLAIAWSAKERCVWLLLGETNKNSMDKCLWWVN